MRLSKARKETLRDHQGLTPSKKELEELRKSRRLKNFKGIKFIHAVEEKPNRKKNRDQRRARADLPGRYVSVVSNNKYNPDGSFKNGINRS